MEASLRAVDPSISHPYWDFMEDAGSNWSRSAIFSDNFFGPVRTDPEDDHVVTSGPFAYLPAMWDKGGNYSHTAAENMCVRFARAIRMFRASL